MSILKAAFFIVILNEVKNPLNVRGGYNQASPPFQGGDWEGVTICHSERSETYLVILNEVKNPLNAFCHSDPACLPAGGPVLAPSFCLKRWLYILI